VSLALGLNASVENVAALEFRIARFGKIYYMSKIKAERMLHSVLSSLCVTYDSMDLATLVCWYHREWRSEEVPANELIVNSFWSSHQKMTSVPKSVFFDMGSASCCDTVPVEVISQGWAYFISSWSTVYVYVAASQDLIDVLSLGIDIGRAELTTEILLMIFNDLRNPNDLETLS
jgi:hypothetical protein